MADLKDLERKLKSLSEQVPQIAKDVIETEGLNFIKKNFRDEGFNSSSGLQKWKPRKTTDKRGRNITRYRTNRVGTAGSLNRYGRKNQGRAILTGYDTAGDKLRNSFRAKQRKYDVVFYTYKEYAKYHNEGIGKQPKRQFMGASSYLNNRIKQKLDKQLKSRMK